MNAKTVMKAGTCVFCGLPHEGPHLHDTDCVKALQEENKRLRAALERIARYEYRGGNGPVNSAGEIDKPSAAKIAQDTLGLGGFLPINCQEAARERR